ncbi:hypothetical protein E0Z10_g2841 [Xylaria hypoxylon]|uniref:Uncharacterized protein n=1 Tax=Xylaria hypoxylon TaxID=37992 RepID=A0A4Z0Z2Y8_9PEZI|nr:hypothetical protein E0Z10_g2841 [Xylaria hypoxylon]
MRSQNPPPGSSSFEPERPTVEEDVSLQTHPVGSNTNTSAYHLTASTNHENLQNSELTSVPDIPAHTQNHHYSTTEGVDEAEATDDEGNDDYDMVDAEEGGAPLYDIDMEETNDQPPMLPLQGTTPGHDVADVSANTAAPQPLIPATANPPTGPFIVNPPPPASQQDIDEDAFEFSADGFEPHPLFLTNANPGIFDAR